jgi:hypothetical protein
MKFVISEEEKKSIMKMYEQYSSSNSKLVAKKNPFNNNQFKNANRSYNSQLTNGELFTEWSPRINFEMIDYLNEKLNGKTILYSFEQQGKKNELKLEFKKNPDLLLDENWITITNLIMNENFDTFETQPVVNSLILQGRLVDGENHQFNLDMVSKNIHKFFVDRYKITRREQFQSISGSQWEKLYNFVVNELLKPSTLPDNMFEIREVEKSKTDFKP